MSDTYYGRAMTTPIKAVNPKQQPPQNDTKSQRRTRGPAVPAINLEKAVSLMRKVWEKEKRNSAPVSSIVTHWEYKPKSSGGFLAIASLKRFGLLDEQGSSKQRTLKLSQLALDLLKNENTAPAEFLKLLKQAALNPKFHREMWTKYGIELPSDQTIESFLVFDKQFPEEVAKPFIREYKETIAFAKLAEGDTIPETAGETDTAEENKNDGQEQFLPAKPTPPPPRDPSKGQPQPPRMSEGVTYFTAPLEAGDAFIPLGMSKGDWELFINTLKVWKSRIVAQGEKTDEADKILDELQSKDITELQNAIRATHGCESQWEASVRVEEKFEGKTAWSGIVEVFPFDRPPESEIRVCLDIS